MMMAPTRSETRLRLHPVCHPGHPAEVVYRAPSPWGGETVAGDVWADLRVECPVCHRLIIELGVLGWDHGGKASLEPAE